MCDPPITDLRFGHTEVVRGRIDELRLFDLDQHDFLESTHLRTARPVEVDGSIVRRPGLQNRCYSPESIALARERIDDIDVDARIHAQILERPWRPDIAESEIIIVPNGDRPLRREIGGAVGADCGEKAESLLVDQPLHVTGENSPIAHTGDPYARSGGVSRVTIEVHGTKPARNSFA